MNTRKELVAQCEREGLKTTGNKMELAERLRRHRDGEYSEYSTRGVPKRQREEPIAFVDAPKHIWYEPSTKDPVLGIPVDVWQKIFLFTRYRNSPLDDFYYKDLLRLRLVCKYFHRPATVLLLQMSKEWIGTEDIMLFGFLETYWHERHTLEMCFGSVLLNFPSSVREICQAFVGEFKNFASVKAKWQYCMEKKREAAQKRAKTLLVKKQRAKELNSSFTVLGLSPMQFNGSWWNTPKWFQNLADRVIYGVFGREQELCGQIVRYLKTGVKTDEIKRFLAALTPAFVEEAREKKWL